MTNQKVTLEAGTYEIIKNRLQEQSGILNKRLLQLNDSRKAIFNTEQFALIANQRITTEHNGVARGIIALEEWCIFAYNVHFGLREEISLNDVFSIYQFKDNHFEPACLSLIQNEMFETDFKNLYKYYREAFFSKFHRTQNYLYMIFQTSKDVMDRKAFKWYIDGATLTYIDDRSIHEVKAAEQYGFQFSKTSLDDRRMGVHPHISIQDKLFIEAIGGDITFKIEDNTSTGLGIYAEPVLHKDQQLDDAQYYYADLGNLIAIKIQPYQEEARAYIFNVRTKEVVNIPSLLESGILLPDDQGIIFSNGYYLQNGTYKIFDNTIANLEYLRTISAPNGEDYCYIYYQKQTNTYVLLSYNVILQEVQTPIVCNGFTIFQDGTLIYFKSEQEAIRHHQVQIWQTPFTASLIENVAMKNNVLYKIGNKDIVAAMAASYEIIQLLKKEDSYEGLYEDLAKQASNVIDSFFWLQDDATYNLAAPIKEIAQIAETAIDEFAKVQAQRKQALAALTEQQKNTTSLAQKIRNASYASVDELVQQLHQVRLLQGSIIALKDIRYMEEAAVEVLLQEVAKYNEQLSQETVDYLVQENALLPYSNQIAAQKQQIELVEKAIDAASIEANCVTIATQLELLIDILNSLKIEDTTQTTAIIEQISVLFASLNEVKALLLRKTNALKSKEAIGSFQAQLTLLEQSIVNFLDLSDTVAKCDSYQTKISVHIEELESKFADFEEFIQKIADKRDEIIRAFQGKKEMLLAQINKRTGNLEQIGLRVLKSIEHKAQTLNSTEEIYAFFSGDLMIEKVRSIQKELLELGDVGKAENIASALKLAQEQAMRNYKDKKELFVDGAPIINLGPYKFAVNQQALSLTILQRQGQLMYHIMGTNFYQPITNLDLLPYQSVWEQDYSSENSQVYKAAYLAYQAFLAHEEQANLPAEQYIQQVIEQDFAGGYIKGVHNDDALRIYQALVHTQTQLGLLEYAPSIRVQALLFWHQLEESQRSNFLNHLAQAHQVHQMLRKPLRATHAYTLLLEAIDHAFQSLSAKDKEAMTSYILKAMHDPFKTIVSDTAMKLKDSLIQYLKTMQEFHQLEQHLLKNNWSLQERWLVILDWVQAFAAKENYHFAPAYLEEAACILALEHATVFEAKENVALITIDQLKGNHPSIHNGSIEVDYHNFIDVLDRFQTYTVPLFQEFQKAKKELLTKYEQTLKLNELQPKPLSSFMRNKLINEVYFPLIGANLAKQLGTVGEDKKTARMGMLLLISPPGYGKTTLMEYLAATMGLHFVKINGPTIGHRIYSIDPTEATTSGARSELERLNLAFEMEDNVLLYLDDIQHCSPEFLQQFISLADGQRKIDGIFNGVSKTYDLRGKRFCIVMAGNPYTESGTKFKIPDMLANRADVYNLGDVVGTSRPLFELSLLENAINDNQYLQQIAQKNIDDLYALFQYVLDQAPILPELKANHSSSAVQDALAVIKNLINIRSVILKVNDLYIQSAGMQDAYRVEPAFKLQGSYRNMNKMANKVVPLMNDQEIEQLISTHYEAEAQTLTADAEANLLKLKSIINLATTEELERYEHIKKTFQKNNQLAGSQQLEQTMQLLYQLNHINENFKDLIQTLSNQKN